jgi:hypothetical protein
MWSLDNAFVHCGVKWDANVRKLPLFLEDYTLGCLDAKSVDVDIIWNPRKLRGHVYARAVLIATARRFTSFSIEATSSSIPLDLALIVPLVRPRPLMLVLAPILFRELITRCPFLSACRCTYTRHGKLCWTSCFDPWAATSFLCRCIDISTECST